LRYCRGPFLDELLQITRYLSQKIGVWAEIFTQDLPKDEGVPVAAVHKKYEILFRTWPQCKLISKCQGGQNFVKVIVGQKKDFM
jgi:hypothetical protein